MLATLVDGSQQTLGGVDEIKNKALKALYKDEFQAEKINDFKTTFKNAAGISYENLVLETKTLSNEALGDANGVTNLLNKYIDSQENFIDKAASFCQIGSIACMAVGGVICIFSGGLAAGAGLSLIKIGQMAALGGTFGDNALEFADKATNQKKFSEESDEYKELLKETLVDGALYAAGYGIGKVAGAFGNFAKCATGSNLIGKVADIGTDAALSLASDYMITGEVDFKGEGLSQFLSIITGTAMARYGASKIDTNSNSRREMKSDDWNTNENWANHSNDDGFGFGFDDSYSIPESEDPNWYKQTGDDDFGFELDDAQITHASEDPNWYKQTDDDDFGFELDDANRLKYESDFIEDFHHRPKQSFFDKIKTTITALKDYNFNKDTKTRIKKQNLNTDDLPYVQKLIEEGCSSQYATNPNIIDLCKAGFEIKEYSAAGKSKGYDILCFTESQFQIALSTKKKLRTK